MWPKFKFFLLLQMSVVYGTSAAGVYEFHPDPKKLLQRCENSPENVLNLDEAFDMSEMTITMVENDYNVHLSGNMTMNWKGVEPTDTMTVSFQVYQYDKNSRTWQATPYGFGTKNFCADMYHPKKYYHMYFSKYITNAADVMDQCINHQGVRLEFEPFEIMLKSNLGYVPNLTGYKKVIITLEAYDNHQQKRPNWICSEVIGEVVQV